MNDSRHNGQLLAKDVDNHELLAAQLTMAFGKIRPGVYAVERGGLIEVHNDVNSTSPVLIARLFPQDAITGLYLLELLIKGE